MCLHYLVKLIARVLSPYITYFSIGLQFVDFWHQIFTNCWNNTFQQSTTVSVMFTYTHYIFFASDAYKFAVTVFSVLWLFQSHAAVVMHYNAFCVKLTANSDTEQNNISKSTFPDVLVNISTFYELWNHWNVTVCHKKGIFVMYGDKTHVISFIR